MNRFYLLSVCTPLGLSLVGAARAQAPFGLSYSSAGILSLQTVDNTHATDYIQSGHALGDPQIRHWSAGSSAWHHGPAAIRDFGSSDGTPARTIPCWFPVGGALTPKKRRATEIMRKLNSFVP